MRRFQTKTGFLPACLVTLSVLVLIVSWLSYRRCNFFMLIHPAPYDSQFNDCGIYYYDVGVPLWVLLKSWLPPLLGDLFSPDSLVTAAFGTCNLLCWYIP